MMLLQAATEGRGGMAEVIMLRQLASMVKAITDMHTAIGDAQRAAQVDRTLREQYTQVRDRLPALERGGAARIGAAMPALTEVLDPERAKIVAAAQRGQVIPGATTLPGRVHPAKPQPAIAPNESDGHEQLTGTPPRLSLWAGLLLKVAQARRTEFRMREAIRIRRL